MAIKRFLLENKYDLWVEEAKKELKNGKAVILKSASQVTKYLAKK
jgi:hypothetical protein